jgi:hypothetical protein
VQLDVGGAKLGAEVIPVLAQLIGDFAGMVKVSLRLRPVVISRGSDRKHQVEGPEEGQTL